MNKIIQGWFRVLQKYRGKLDDSIIERAEKRLKQCEPCELNFKERCLGCGGCPLVAKSLTELDDKNICKKGLWQN